MADQNRKSISALKCKDCSTSSVEVRKNSRYDENLCSGCFIIRVKEEIIASD